ncbi:tetratricopeptide repeat protein [Desulfobulbus sp. US4]|nr:tetratricopeptide repeat protein [Desulfobulbus sp. US4]
MKDEEMVAELTDNGMAKIENLPFSILVKDDTYLSSLRRDYASMPAQERRQAADWEYHSHIANEMFNDSMAVIEKEGFEESYWPSGVIALTIDPFYGPAILTVGSIEYQLGRIEEAMKLFNRLLKLPKNEEDLSTTIDKAGDFLIDQDDYKNALALYSAAEKAFPLETLYSIGAGYCLGKLGLHEESLEKHRHADALEPDNYMHLNDLGYSLLEVGKFEEAEEALKRSISLAPSDYEFPTNNLRELKKRKMEK